MVEVGAPKVRLLISTWSHESLIVLCTGDELRLSYIIESRPSPEFGYEAGKNKLINLNLATDNGPEIHFVTPGNDDAYESYQEGNEFGFTGRQGKLLRLSTWIDLESRVTIGCAGAVLTYIGRRRAVEHLPNDDGRNARFQISTVEIYSLQETMSVPSMPALNLMWDSQMSRFVNADTLSSLQILQSESSPNAHSQGPTKMASGSKEGLSVYGLFHNLARTPQGKNLLRQYFLRPSLSKVIINERLDTISKFVRPDNDGPMKSIAKSLGQIKNMRTVMIHLRKGISTGLSKGGGIKGGIWSSLRSVNPSQLRFKRPC